MRAKSLALLSLALGCGLVASIGITQVMAKRGAAPAAALGEMEKIYVAARDIPLNEVLSAQILRLEQWPRDKIPPGAVSKLEEVEGRRCRTRLYAGEAILKTKLFGKGQGDLGSTSAQIPKGFRVVSVRVDAVSGASSLILPGDRVDLLVHLLPNPAAGIVEPTTRTVLQNIKVFAVDNVVGLDDMDSGGKSIAAKTISLLVSPEQAQKVTMATELGQVRLVMRSPEDDDASRVDGVTPRELFGKPDAGQLVKDSAPAEDTGKATAPQDFIEMLKATMKGKQEPGAAPVKPAVAQSGPSRYVMRLLLGSKRGEAVFEPQGDGEKPTSWRLVSEDGADSAAAGLPSLPPVAPAAGPDNDQSSAGDSAPAPTSDRQKPAKPEGTKQSGKSEKSSQSGAQPDTAKSR